MMLLARTGEFAFVALVALVNLGIGFVTAVAVRRKMRKGLSRPDTSHSDDAATLPATTMPAPDVSQVLNLIESMANTLERCETQLQEFLAAPATEGGAEPDAHLESLKQVVLDLPRRLSATMNGLQGTTQPAGDLIDQTTGALQTLKKNIQATAAVVQSATGRSDVLRESAETLLHACQEARGTMNVVLFSQLTMPDHP
jgi:hypothetical protein